MVDPDFVFTDSITSINDCEKTLIAIITPPIATEFVELVNDSADSGCWFDAEAQSRVLVDHHEDPRLFFAERLPALGRKRISRAEASFCAED